jgi:hypothetical protein
MCTKLYHFSTVKIQAAVFYYFSTFIPNYKVSLGQDSSVSIATGYELDGPGIESWWGEIFRTCPDRPWGPPSLQYNGYWVFPRGKAAGAWQ